MSDFEPAPPESGGGPPRFIGTYRVKRVLGSGGMGRVYLADDPLGGEVAVKLIRVEGNRSQVDHLRAETLAVGAFVHPGVMGLRAAFEWNESFALVTAYVEGEDLFSYTQHADPASVHAAFVQLGEALAYVHGERYAHLDLKPSNIIVAPNGQVVLIDFSLAWPFGRRPPSRAGTPPYIPPEILGGWRLAVDGRADQYSLGVILYEVLMGRRPGRHSTASVGGGQLSPFWSAEDLRRFPSALRLLLLRMLKRWPEDRFASMGAFVEALKAVDPSELKVRPAAFDVQVAVDEGLIVPPEEHGVSEFARQEGWELLGPCGQGSFGRVFRARRAKVECADGFTEAALKAVSYDFPDTALSSRYRARFSREVAVTRTFQHPGVVHMMGSMEGTSFGLVIMEYVPCSLAEWLGRFPAGRPRMREVVRLMAEVCDGLDAAHRHGVYHRDIKPENIRVTSDGHAKIIDFGLASWRDAAVRLTATGEAPGTTAFEAPEALYNPHNWPVIPARLDIYSIGATLYALLACRPMFFSYDEDQKEERFDLNRWLQPDEEVDSPRLFEPDIPVELEALILECVARDPNRRPESPAAVGQGLARALPLLADDAPRAPAPAPSPQSARRKIMNSIPPVGRTREFERLRGWLDDVVANVARAVVVRGPAGIGRGLLISAFSRGMKGLSSALFLKADASRTDALSEWLDGAGEHDPSLCAEVAKRTNGTEEELAAILDVLCGRGPVVLSLLGAESLTPAALSSISCLLRRLQESCLFLLVEHRTETPAEARAADTACTSLAKVASTAVLDLPGLDVHAVSHLASAILGTRVDRRLSRKLRHGTAGRPGLLLAVLEAIRAAGSIPVSAAGQSSKTRICEGTGRGGRATAALEPIMEQAAVRPFQARLKALRPDAISLLRACAQFDGALLPEVMEAATGWSPDRLKTAWDALMAEGILVPRPPRPPGWSRGPKRDVRGVFGFATPLLAGSLRAQTSAVQAIEVRRDAAAFLERMLVRSCSGKRSADRVQPTCGEAELPSGLWPYVARWYEQAGERARAVAAWRRVAAVKGTNYRRQLYCWRRVERLLRAPGGKVSALYVRAVLECGRLLRSTGAETRARRRLQRAQRLARRHAGPVLRALTCVELARAVQNDDPKKALALAEEACGLAVGPHREQKRVRAYALFVRGHIDAATREACFDEAEAIARAIGDTGRLAEIVLHRGFIMRQRDSGAATALFHDCRRLARKHGHAFALVHAYNNLAEVYGQLAADQVEAGGREGAEDPLGASAADVARAGRMAERFGQLCLGWCARLGETYVAAHFRINRGALRYRLGAWGAAVRDWRTAAKLLHRLERWDLCVTVLLNLAAVLQNQGRWKAAFSAAEQGARVVQGLDNPMLGCLLLLRQGVIRLNQGRLEEADNLLSSAMALAEESNVSVGRPELLAGQALCRARRHGWDPEAERLIRDSLKVAATVERPHVLRRWGECLAHGVNGRAHPRWAEACARFEHAAGEAATVLDRFEQAEARAGLGRLQLHGASEKEKERARAHLKAAREQFSRLSAYNRLRNMDT